MYIYGYNEDPLNKRGTEKHIDSKNVTEQREEQYQKTGIDATIRYLMMDN
jgi:hypothetical protein